MSARDDITTSEPDAAAQTGKDPFSDTLLFSIFAPNEADAEYIPLTLRHHGVRTIGELRTQRLDDLRGTLAAAVTDGAWSAFLGALSRRGISTNS